MKKSMLFSLFLFSFLIFTEISSAQDSRTYVISNNTGMTISSLSFSRADSNDFSANILATTNALANGGVYNYDWHGYPTQTCFWDVKYITGDGKEYLLEDVNLCTEKSITILYNDLLKGKEKNEENTPETK